MLLSGLQKLTLLDYPGKVACTIFTPGCNFRCPFCHNASLVLPERKPGYIDQAELSAYLQKRRGLLDGVVVTGGEPLLQPELPQLLTHIKSLGYSIKLDTNGTNPARLQSLAEAGLVDYVAMDIKNAPALYAKTAGVPSPDLDAIAASKDYLLSGPVDYEFRTTVVRGLHTAESIAAAAKWITGARAYYLQGFKDSGDLIAGGGLDGFDAETMYTFAAAARQYVPATAVRGI